jgi:hypothetical protein
MEIDRARKEKCTCRTWVRISEMFIPLNIPITAMNTTVLTEAPTLWSRTNLMAVFVMDSFPSWFSATFPSLFGPSSLDADGVVVGNECSRNFWKA